jgi:hypothetical protein
MYNWSCSRALGLSIHSTFCKKKKEQNFSSRAVSFFHKTRYFCLLLLCFNFRLLWKQEDSIIYPPGYEVSQLNSSFQISGAQSNDLFYALRSICHSLADTPEYTFWKDTWHKNHVFFCPFRCALCFSYRETIQTKDPPPTRVDLEEV